MPILGSKLTYLEWAGRSLIPPRHPLRCRATQLSATNPRLDLLWMNWQRYIIRYSVNDQTDMVRFFGSGGRDAMDSLKSLTSLEWKNMWISNQRWTLLILLVMVCYIFLLRKSGFSPPSSQAVLLYEELQKRLEKNGIKIKPHWTARELLNSNIPTENSHQEKQTTDYYEKVRFGYQPTNPSVEKEIKVLLISI